MKPWPPRRLRACFGRPSSRMPILRSPTRSVRNWSQHCTNTSSSPFLGSRILRYEIPRSFKVSTRGNMSASTAWDGNERHETRFAARIHERSRIPGCNRDCLHSVFPGSRSLSGAIGSGRGGSRGCAAHMDRRGKTECRPPGPRARNRQRPIRRLSDCRPLSFRLDDVACCRSVSRTVRANGDGAARVRDLVDLADPRDRRDNTHDLHTGRSLAMASRQGSRDDAEFSRYFSPCRRRQPEHARTVRYGVSRHVAICLCTRDRVCRWRPRTRHRRGDPGAALRTCPTGADRRRRLCPWLGKVSRRRLGAETSRTQSSGGDAAGRAGRGNKRESRGSGTAVSANPADAAEAPVLSVVIPVYNELGTIGRVLTEVAKALPEVAKQIIIVDDKSSDGTSEWLSRNLARTTKGWRHLAVNAAGELELSADGPGNHASISFTVLFHERNRGKGAAVRT